MYQFLHILANIGYFLFKNYILVYTEEHVIVVLICISHSEGDQPWDFFGRNDAKAETPVLWPPHAKS